MKIFKSLSVLIVIAILISVLSITSFAVTAGTREIAATPSNASILVNGKAITFEVFIINGNSFFKLRDLAAALNGTTKQFQVIWNKDDNAIILTSGIAYTSVGGELSKSKTANSRIATLKNLNIYLNNSQTNVMAYNIGGSNYFKLRDIAVALDFGVTWDNSLCTINIDTTKAYSGNLTLASEFLSYNTNAQLTAVFDLADAALLSNYISEFSDVNKLSSDQLYNFFILNPSIDSHVWYNNNDKKCYIPVKDVTGLLNNYFENYTFIPSKVTFALYDASKNAFITPSTSGFSSVTFIEITKKEAISDDTVILRANYYNRYDNPSSNEILISKEITLKITANGGYKFISNIICK